MPKKKADWFDKEPEYRKLVEARFSKIGLETLRNLLAELRSDYSEVRPKELSKQVLSYLNHGRRQVRVKYKDGEIKVSAAMVAERFDFYTSKGRKLYAEELDELVMPFIVFPDLNYLKEPMRQLRQEAQELELEWERAEPILRNVVKFFSKNQKSSRARGESARLSQPPLHKRKNFSEYFDGAGLTSRQRECLELAYEYELPIMQIARKLRLDERCELIIQKLLRPS